MNLSALYYRSLQTLGVPALNRRLRDAGVILCYHNVAQPGDCRMGEPGLHVPRDRFEWQMRWLVDHYRVVTLREFVDRMTAGASLRSVAAITFDDGYAGVFEHAAPVLQALGLPATVFVVADAVGRPAGFWWDRSEVVAAATPDRRKTWLTDLRGDGEAILAAVAAPTDADLPASHRPADRLAICTWLTRGIEIGVHSTTHRSLPTLTDAELECEVVTSRELVHRMTGVWPQFFAYPYGHWDPRGTALLRSAGYLGAFTLKTGLNGTLTNPWSLSRINVPAQISNAAFEAWTAGLAAFRRN